MLYKYVGHEDPNELVNILRYFVEDGTIRASCPHDFNDPAEFKAQIEFTADKETIRERYFSMWPQQATEEHFELWYSANIESGEWFDVYSIRRNFLMDRGVICLTRRPDNYLMWSHYARSHSGFCIGFDDDMSLEFGDDRIISGEVQYTRDIPTINFFTDTAEIGVPALCLNKNDAWSYEEEFRVVTRNHGIKTFNKSLIREITIGCKPSSEIEEYARQFIGSNINVYKMLCPPDSYQLTKVELKEDVYFQGY